MVRSGFRYSRGIDVQEACQAGGTRFQKENVHEEHLHQVWGGNISIHTQQSRQNDIIAYTMCIKCHKETSTKGHAEDSHDGAKSESSAIHGFISAVDSSTPAPEDIQPTESGSVQSSYSKKHAKKIVLDHHIFTQDGWRRATSLSHPTLRLRIFTCDDDYQSFVVR